MENHKLNSYYTDAKNNIKHEGIVTKITNQKLVVSLKGNINCEGCKAKSVCGSPESNHKEIEVLGSNFAFNLNDTVNITISKNQGMKAVFWAYILPFILMVTVLFTVSLFEKEWVAGVLSLVVLIPYYVALYLYKNTFYNSFKFSILKTE